MHLAIAVCLVMGLIFASPAYAYLDPGTGSYFLQLILASMLGVLLSVRIFWTRIKEFFRNLTRRKDG